MATDRALNCGDRATLLSGIHRKGLVMCLITLVLILCALRPARAESEVLPSALQVALFRKIFGYNKALVPPLKILIVYANDFTAMAEEVQKNFERSAQASEKLSLAEFSRRTAGVTIVYVLANAVPSVVQQFCMREHVFSVSPFPALAERGEVSVAVGIKQDRMSEIVVHLNRAKQEGQELSMALLSLARVIR
jgi:hypothetical protein